MCSTDPNSNNSPPFSLSGGGFVIDQLIDRIAIPAFVIDAQHQITHWNHALANLSGLSARQMVGTSNQWQPFYCEPRPTMADLIVDGSLSDTVDRFYHNKYKPSDLIEGAFMAEDFFPEMGDEGEWLSFTASPLHGPDKQVIGAIETLVIISDRVKAEQELKARARKYRELSTTDNLTGLSNNRQFFAELNKELERAGRYRHTLALCMVDIDHFKSVNDSYGHPFGDRVLEGVGQLIARHLRAVDSGYRYGGEEFAVLMPQSGIAGSTAGMERLRKALEAEPFVTDSGELVPITASIGIATLIEGESGQALFKRADSALYQSKRDGRNRVTVDLAMDSQSAEGEP